MNSLIFSVMVKWIQPALWVVSLWLFFRGHNAPGGGFIAGLVAASAVILQVLSAGWSSLNKIFRENLFEIAGLGLTIAIVSGIIPMLIGNPFMTGRWGSLLGYKSGTPVLFDLGVYVTVFAVVVICAGYLLWEEEEEQSQ